MPRKEINERAKYLMEKLDIDHLADRYLSEVSGGQLQRASICRALMNEPNILLPMSPQVLLIQAPQRKSWIFFTNQF